MNKKKMLQIVSLMLCVAFIGIPPALVNAEELASEEPVYYDTEQGRFVNDIDVYLKQLNEGMITPFDSTIADYESEATPLDLHDPTDSCSNIFGHKWSEWGNWEEVSIVHFPKPPCAANMERWRYCTRTHCSALQKETDVVWINSCNH